MLPEQEPERKAVHTVFQGVRAFIGVNEREQEQKGARVIESTNNPVSPSRSGELRIGTVQRTWPLAHHKSKVITGIPRRLCIKTMDQATIW
jgi:hypothetical protein